jgi:hypothetical protein
MDRNIFGGRFGEDGGSNGNLIPYTGEVITLGPPPTTNPLILSDWIEHGSNSKLVKSMVAEASHEQGRAILAKSALDNVAALSVLEAQLRYNAPLGAARYKTIIDAYTVSTAMRIARW